MKILYLGDVMAEAGIKVVEELLPCLRHQYAIDLVIAQAENVTDGRGITRADFKRLRTAGVDFCTGGNWTLNNTDIHDYLADPQQPIIRPANYPQGTAGKGYKYLETKHGKVLVVSLLGDIVGKDSDKPVDNALQVIDKILDETEGDQRAALVVNLHGDFSSQKVMIGYYLDGKASLVVGDHWHVPTADAMILPQGTAHVTDVGMCGSLHSSLGVELDSVIPRWRDGRITRNMLSNKRPYQLNGLLADINDDGLATSVLPIRQIID
ncbi:MAG: TIGR00282 family metallophosphoesterase [Candidatus Saccharimonadales bacterium]